MLSQLSQYYHKHNVKSFKYSIVKVDYIVIGHQFIYINKITEAAKIGRLRNTALCPLKPTVIV